MKSNILHITNGDITTQTLKKLAFKGNIITWREMLCEGKTTTDVGSEGFWKTRYDFLKSSYKVTKKTFIDFTLKEYRLLCKRKEQDEIALWFDSDLFCQVNMLAVISWLKRFRKGKKVTLVQSKITKGKHTDINKLTKTQLQKQFKDRVELSKDDIEYADYIWQLYCSDSPLRLENVHKFNPMSPFVHLEKALKAHLLRFPSIKNGLNAVENNILQTVQKNQFNSKEELVNHLVKSQETLGFGDKQYFQKIEELRSLFQTFNPIKLRKLASEIISNEVNYYAQMRSEYAYLGGAKKYSYLYVDNKDKLLKITS